MDYREQPQRYKVGKGEQGVLICEPYKSEIGQHWRFRTPEIAKVSSEKINEMFDSYLKGEDFVGADMARKYLQMDYTRARRYANYKGVKNVTKLTAIGPWKGEPGTRKRQLQQLYFTKIGKLPRRIHFTPD